VLCFEADPDQPLELRAADVVLLPGECAEAPRRKGGSIALHVVDGRGPSWRKRVQVPRGRRTTVTLAEEKRRPKTTRTRCTRTPG
jgi:hypothetical protein